jgi:hypothetical protein
VKKGPFSLAALAGPLFPLLAFREVVDLHPELRALVDEVLSTGYLADAEAAFQRGEIPDYFLFPTGKLKAGACVPLCRATQKPVSDPGA